MIDPKLWASVPFRNRTAFLDFAGSVELWLRAVAAKVSRDQGVAVRVYPLGTPGGAEWFKALQQVFADANNALGVAPPPNLTDYDLSVPEDFASFTWILSQAGQTLRSAAGIS